MVFNGEGCATIVLLYTCSGEKNDEEGKKTKKKCVAQTWLDLNSGCEE